MPEDLSMAGASARMASVPSENEVLGGLSKGIAGGEELDAGTREYLSFLADDIALEQVGSCSWEGRQMLSPAAHSE